MSNFVLSFYFLCIDKGHASPKIGFKCWAGRKNYGTHQNQDEVKPPIDNGGKPLRSNKSKQAVLIEKTYEKIPDKQEQANCANWKTYEKIPNLQKLHSFEMKP